MWCFPVQVEQLVVDTLKWFPWRRWDSGGGSKSLSLSEGREGWGGHCSTWSVAMVCLENWRGPCQLHMPFVWQGGAVEWGCKNIAQILYMFVTPQLSFKCFLRRGLLSTPNIQHKELATAIFFISYPHLLWKRMRKHYFSGGVEKSREAQGRWVGEISFSNVDLIFIFSRSHWVQQNGLVLSQADPPVVVWDMPRILRRGEYHNFCWISKRKLIWLHNSSETEKPPEKNCFSEVQSVGELQGLGLPMGMARQGLAASAWPSPSQKQQLGPLGQPQPGHWAPPWGCAEARQLFSYS